MKTRPTDESVDDFVASIVDVRRRGETARVVEMMARVTGARPRVWGAAMIGFGECRYRDAKGREHGWFLTGVAPRKQALAIQIVPRFEPLADLMAALGRHRTGRSCLYMNRLESVDSVRLEWLVAGSVTLMRESYGA